MASRAKHDSQTKAAVVEQVLAGKLSIEQACRKHDLQQSQLYAWIGQHALRKAMSGSAAAETKPQLSQSRAVEATEQEMDTLSRALPASEGYEPELERIIGRYFLNKRVRSHDGPNS